MEVKPKIIFVFSKEGTATSTKYGGFAKRLQKTGALKNHEVLTVALENLVYIIDENGEARVYDSVSGCDMAEATLVYLKSWQSMPNEAAALANYLFYKGIPFADTLALGKGTSKLVTTLRQWGSGVRVPTTIYARKNEVLTSLFDSVDITTLIGERFILKDAEGTKGKLNFFVTVEEAKKIITQHPEICFICQRFIPNNGDYRVGVYGEKPLFVLQRTGDGSSHLNNTSMGGKGVYVPLVDAPKNLLSLAQKAARASELQIAGVDMIQDKDTKRWYVLEVNQGSQIVTGMCVEENIQAFSTGLVSMLKTRKTRTRKLPRKIIGRRAFAKLPLLGVEGVVAKIDTGAYSSTLHADNIQIELGNEGVEILKFDITPSPQLQTRDNETVTMRTSDFFVQKVRSSNGHIQERYSVRTKISLDGIRFSAILTLSDRSEMGYPLLIGRKLLRSRFIVNVELNENHDIDWRY